MKELYSKNDKILEKDIEETINGRIYHAHGLERSILLKYPYCLKQYKHSVQPLIKYQWHSQY